MNILKNSSIVVLGLITASIISYIFHIYVGRTLGPSEYGVFGALISLLLIASFPAQAISPAISKFVARYNSKKQYDKVRFLKKILVSITLIYSIILFTLFTLFSKMIASYLKINSVVLVIIVGFSIIFYMLLQLNRGILQGMKKFSIYSGIKIFESFLKFFLVIIFLFLGLKVSGVLLSYVLTYLFSLLLILPFIKNNNTIKEKKFDMNEIYKFIMLILFLNIFFQLIVNAPTIIIKHFFSSDFTGYWTAALTLAKGTLLLTSGITIVMFPEIASKLNKKEQKFIFHKAIVLTLIASILVSIFYIIFGELIITLLYGNEFLGAISILRWMALAMIGISVIQISVSYYLAKK